MILSSINLILRSISPVPTSITMARSSDDSRCNYSSLDMVRKTQEMAEDDVRDSVRLQKMFRKLQRQVHSPEHQVSMLGVLNIYFFISTFSELAI